VALPRKDPNAALPVRQALSEAFADRDIHDKRAANRDWELIFAMFRRQLFGLNWL
jgi:hypothetical protein